MKMFFLLFICASLCAEPIVSVSSKTKKPINLIRKMLREVPVIDKERKELGLSPIINLSIGQPHVAMNRQVLDPLIEYLEGLRELAPEEFAKEMGYSHSAGLYETRFWISKAFSYDFPEVKEGFVPNEVMVTNGAAGALTNTLKVLVEQGDAVAVFSPYFAAYKNQVEDNGATLIPIPIDKDRSFAALLEKAFSEHPEIKVFLWNDPNNPLGTKASKEEMQALGDLLMMHPNIIVIHDEVYRDFNHAFHPLSLLNIKPELKPRSILIRSLAKDTLGAPGIRAGMLAAPIALMTPSGKRANLIELMANEQLRDIVSISVLVQKTLVFALQAKLDGKTKHWTTNVLQEYKKNTNIVAQSLYNMGLSCLLQPAGAFYVMADASSIIGKTIPDSVGKISDLHARIGKSILENDQDVVAFFLYAAGVAVVPGSGFDSDQPSFRISCAKDEKYLYEAMKRIDFAMKHLQ